MSTGRNLLLRGNIGLRNGEWVGMSDVDIMLGAIGESLSTLAMHLETIAEEISEINARQKRAVQGAAEKRIRRGVLESKSKVIRMNNDDVIRVTESEYDVLIEIPVESRTHALGKLRKDLNDG